MVLEMMQWESEWRRKDHISKRAEALRPAYRAEPLRYLNISDEEIRQVQLVSVKFLPRALVNISPVVTNCPCEEGPNCAAQVYVVATTGENLQRPAAFASEGPVGRGRRAAVVVSARKHCARHGKRRLARTLSI